MFWTLWTAGLILLAGGLLIGLGIGLGIGDNQPEIGIKPCLEALRWIIQLEVVGQT